MAQIMKNYTFSLPIDLLNKLKPKIPHFFIPTRRNTVNTGKNK
jgi:hypothetical protein